MRMQNMEGGCIDKTYVLDKTDEGKYDSKFKIAKIYESNRNIQHNMVISYTVYL